MAGEKKESIWTRPIGGGGKKEPRAPKAPKAPRAPKTPKSSDNTATAKNEKPKKQSVFSRPIGGGGQKAGSNGGWARTVRPARGGRGRMPTKQSINLVINEKKGPSPVKAIVFSVIIIIAAAAFSKFMIIDRMIAMSEATGHVNQLRTTLAATEEAVASFGDISDTYAHYTYSGMTDEEKSLVSRTAVLEMADAAFASGGASNNWQLSGNTLTAEVTGSSLEELNELAQFLQSFPIVDRCTITNANKTTNEENYTSEVRASFIIYLQQPAEEEGGEQS